MSNENDNSKNENNNENDYEEFFNQESYDDYDYDMDNAPVRETDPELEKAHKFSFENKEALLKDKVCGCFYCLEIFDPKEIEIWLHDKNGETAVCPYCGIDAVIGESSGFPITKDFLRKMSHYYFDE